MAGSVKRHIKFLYKISFAGISYFMVHSGFVIFFSCKLSKLLQFLLSIWVKAFCLLSTDNVTREMQVLFQNSRYIYI